VFCSRVRTEEKQLFQAMRARGIPYLRVDVRDQVFDLTWETLVGDIDVALIRCLSHTRALYISRMLESQGVRVVNAHDSILTCGDKVLTSMALQASGILAPHTAIAFSRKAALDAVSGMGYPVVMKPPVGSWGRLLAKVNDRESAEAVLEHKGSMNGKDPYFIQNYVEKPGRDIRTLVVGEETVYAVYRHAQHWITNTARGGKASRCPITKDIDRVSRTAARAVGGEVVAVDLLETDEGGLLVNEVNHTPEFHGAVKAVDVDVAGKIVEYLQEVRQMEKQTDYDAVKRKNV